MGDVRYEILAEENVPEQSLALAADLLQESFGAAMTHGRSWILRRPLYRVLAWDSGVLVGNEMGCLVGCSPPIARRGSPTPPYGETGARAASPARWARSSTRRRSGAVRPP